MHFLVLLQFILGMILVVRVMMEIIVVVVPASVVQVVDHSHLMEAVITYPVMIKQIYN